MKVIIYYDGYCSMCRASSTLWQKLDWMDKLNFTSFRKLSGYPKEMEKQLFVDYHGKWFKGFDGILQIVKKLPLLWIVLPFLYVFKWLGLGSFIYNTIAKNRKIVPVNQCDGDGDACMIHPNQDSSDSSDK